MTDLQKILLHIKSLVWCLSKARQKYNLGLIVASLSDGRVLEPLRNTNLGDNLIYILSVLKRPKDMRVLITCLEALPGSASSAAFGGEKYEIGHYLQALEDLPVSSADRQSKPRGKAVPKGTYGIISCLNEHLRGLFYIEGKGLVETAITPKQVRVIYGTMI